VAPRLTTPFVKYILKVHTPLQIYAHAHFKAEMIAGNAILLVSSIAPPQRLRHRRIGMRLYLVIESALGGFWQDFPEDLALFRADHRLL